MRFKLNNFQKMVFFAFVIVIVVFSLALFQTYSSFSEQNNELLAKISNLNTQLSKTSEQLSLKDVQLLAQLSIFDKSLNNLRAEQRNQNENLLKLIQELEEKSNLQLDELKKELENVSLKSGDFSTIAGNALPAVVSVETDKARGSGVLVKSNGFIVTNYHVVSDAGAIQVRSYNRGVFPAILAGFDSASDITVLKVQALSLPFLEFGDSSKLKVGQKVIALGNPFGLDFTVTEGIISSLNRSIPGLLGTFIQTDVPMNAGNSGGPLVDSDSKVVGVNNLKIIQAESLGFAIPSNTVKQVSEQIIQQFESQV